ncbi:LPS export ABC transporter periplasmic protein LptC [Lusitaniella coriacea LEGE 07157]|uniref:LPS export ABC transporter periplasmic protein LptC n=1 Tax=Lusitaniella coriacea LEGE 07157 TaxID=945747 RepID=A0A8J7B3H9_9CYAN|nr:LPS export ABC transporter periplasmic protein LptC [Lusitaniella coriacea]MBE9115067.1 LPS export ABC transporter periplasmic protein LptC [Lusitaniella coriacea LEGE 07157]
MLKKIRSKRRTIAPGVFPLVLLLVVACRQQPPAEPQAQPESPTQEQIEKGLVARNATIEQTNEEGETLWKINVEQAVYDQDKKNVKLKQITGDLYQDDKVILQVRAQNGEIENEGEKILLRDKVVAIDPRNKAVFKSEELEWKPKEDSIAVRRNLVGSNANINASATEGKYFSREQKLELNGQVKATSKEPPLQMRAEGLVWEIVPKIVKSDRAIAIDRYQGKTITDRLVSDKGQLNLGTKIATVEGNVELKSTNPPMQIATSLAVWNITTRTVQSDRPVQAIHRKDQFSVTGNQGVIDLNAQVARMSGGIHGISTPRKANLYANQLVWQIPQQTLNAKGNVVYNQADPPLHLKGPQAIGKLKDQRIAIVSDKKERVVTEITP